MATKAKAQEIQKHAVPDLAEQLGELYERLRASHVPEALAADLCKIWLEKYLEA